jgi:hypothetical protein
MTARPVARRRGPDIDRHADAVAGVVRRAPHLGQIPTRTQIAGAHFGIGLKATCREYDGAGRDVPELTLLAHLDATDGASVPDQRQGPGFIQDIDTGLSRGVGQHLYQARPAADGFHRQAAPELELAIDLEGLAAVDGHETHTGLPHPDHGRKALADQYLAEVGIAAELGDAKHVVEKLVFGVGAEIGGRDFLVRQIRYHGLQIVKPTIGKAHGARGKAAVAAAQILRRAFQDQHAGATLAGRKRRAKRRIAGTDDDDIVILLLHVVRILFFR